MKQDSIFRAYDIRGDYPSQINEELAYLVGRAIVLFLKTKQIIVGRDCRNSSKELSQSIIKGITEQGAQAIDAGLCSTPMISFSSKDKDAVMITASHLPAQKNGIKIFKKGVTAIGIENGLLKIKKFVEKNGFPEAKSFGEIQHTDLMQEYTAHVLKSAKNIKKLKVVIDAGNGMAGYIAPFIFSRLPCEFVKVYFELNGNFPNRSPDPMNSNALNYLSETIKKEKADLGAAYDADCDRIIFVDEKGTIVAQDIILALLAQNLPAKKENVVYELTCSKIVPETIKKSGKVPIISKVGHTMIQQVMQKKKAILGGERSGHYFFRENFFADSGDIALLQILSLLSKTGKKLSELIALLKKYYGTQQAFATQNKETTIKKVLQEFKKQETKEKIKIRTLDGISAEFEDWWFNLRASNTESLVRLTIEANNKSLLSQKIKEVSAIVTKYC